MGRSIDSGALGGSSGSKKRKKDNPNLRFWEMKVNSVQGINPSSGLVESVDGE
jgi:hypothetical protein